MENDLVNYVQFLVIGNNYLSINYFKRFKFIKDVFNTTKNAFIGALVKLRKVTISSALSA